MNKNIRRKTPVRFIHFPHYTNQVLKTASQPVATKIHIPQSTTSTEFTWIKIQVRVQTNESAVYTFAHNLTSAGPPPNSRYI